MSHLRAARNGGPDGFTVIELLIALAITLLIAGALAQSVAPAHAAFDRVPAELDLQQRGRTAIDVLSQALRSAMPIGELNESGDALNALTIVAPIVNGAQGILAADQSAPGATITLSPSPCPNVQDVCGFSAGATALITDAGGHSDVFVVASTSAGLRTLTPNHGLSQPYPAGAAVVEIAQSTFSLAGQADGSASLIRTTAAGAVQPVIDFVSDLWFTVTGPQVDVTMTVQPPTAALRRVLSDRVFRMSIRLRNGHE
jgi:prepilin-type N-terminal cleavage/methylation domain-containing protein